MADSPINSDLIEISAHWMLNNGQFMIVFEHKLTDNCVTHDYKDTQHTHFGLNPSHTTESFRITALITVWRTHSASTVKPPNAVLFTTCIFCNENPDSNLLHSHCNCYALTYCLAVNCRWWLDRRHCRRRPYIKTHSYKRNFEREMYEFPENTITVCVDLRKQILFSEGIRWIGITRHPHKCKAYVYLQPGLRRNKHKWIYVSTSALNNRVQEMFRLCDDDDLLVGIKASQNWYDSE